MKIDTFIFNWRGQYSKTIEKLAQFKKLGIQANVINSDEAHNDEINVNQGWFNVGEDAYYTAQITKAIELFDGDILFLIQADASYDDWKKLIDDAVMYKKWYNWGVFAPNVDYTWYDSTRTDIVNVKLEHDNLREVACTDCTCWFIDKTIIDAFKARTIDMTPYHMGWGWDILFPALTFLDKRHVLRDYSHTIKHPEGTNYNKNQAEEEMRALFEALPVDLKAFFYYIKADRQQISSIFEKSEEYIVV